MKQICLPFQLSMGGQQIMRNERNIHKTDRRTDRMEMVSEHSKSRLEENMLEQKERSKSCGNVM